MIEQYEKVAGSWSYYKCNLCAAHGKLDAIYKHIIGNRHTEKYIVRHDHFFLCNLTK